MAGDTWYYAQDGRSVGPMSFEELLKKLPDAGGAEALVYGPSTTGWLEARHIPAIADVLRGAARRRCHPRRAVRTRSTMKSSARRCSTSKSRSTPRKS